MAARLTDKQKKKIIADYIQIESYNAVAKMNGVSKDTVKRVVQNCADFAQKAQQKKEENTADILAYMERQKTVARERVNPCFTRRFAIVITFDFVLFIWFTSCFGFGSFLTL